MDRCRKPIDMRKLHEASVAGLCYVCEFLNGNPEFDHVTVEETDTAIAFLSRYPTLFGYMIVAPKKHVEQATGDFTEAEYVRLQSFIYRLSEAVREVLEPERNYILSLGSQAANAHVHWHIAPLPYGVPIEYQQFHALMHENGVIEVSKQDQEELAAKIKDAFSHLASNPEA